MATSGLDVVRSEEVARRRPHDDGGPVAYCWAARIVPAAPVTRVITGKTGVWSVLPGGRVGGWRPGSRVVTDQGGGESDEAAIQARLNRGDWRCGGYRRYRWRRVGVSQRRIHDLGQGAVGHQGGARAERYRHDVVDLRLSARRDHQDQGKGRDTCGDRGGLLR